MTPRSPDPRGFLAIDPRFSERVEGLEQALAPCRRQDGPLTIDGNSFWTGNHLMMSLWPDPDTRGFRGVRNLSLVNRGVSFGQIGYEAIPTIYYPVASDDGLAWRTTGKPLIVEDVSPTVRRLNERIGYKTPFMEATIFEDELEPDPQRRYKMVWHGEAFIEGDPPRVAAAAMTDEAFAQRVLAGEKPEHGLYAACSPDMRHWQDLAVIDHGPPIGYVPGSSQWAGGDGFPSVIRDAAGEYVMFHRTNVDRQGKRRERAVGRWQSRDFRQWSPHQMVMRTDIDRQAERGVPKHDVYYMQAWPQLGGYWGIIDVFYWQQDRTHLELAWSPDTIEWTRVCPSQDLVPQEPLGSYGGGCNTAAYRPWKVGDEWWVYYGGSTGKHNAESAGDSTLLLARFDKLRMAGLRTTGSQGSLLSRPVLLSKEGIRLNVDASHGSALVSLLDQNAQPIKGYGPGDAEPVRGDQASSQVAWKGGADSRSLAGRSVRVLVELSDATLYEVHI